MKVHMGDAQAQQQTMYIEFEGNFDIYQQEELADRFFTTINDSHCHLLVLDLTRVTFIDSHLLKMLDLAHCTLLSRGGILQVIMPNNQAVRAIEHFLRLFPGLREVFHSFTPQPIFG